MPHNPITLDLLRTLQAIDQNGSFAAAAEAINKVPSALTYTIQKVEQDLGLQLFDRSGHKARMTDAGRLILRDGQKVLDQLDQLADNAKQVALGWEVNFTIVFDTVIDIASLFPIIRTFQQTAPFVRVKVREESLSGSWESLQKRTANMLIAPRQTFPSGTTDIESIVIGHMDMVLAVASDHPLCSVTGAATPEQLLEYPVVVVPDSTTRTSSVSTGLSYQEKHFFVPGMTEKIKAQVAGLGIGYLPRYRIREQLETGQLVEIRTTDEQVRRDQLLIAWRKGDEGKVLEWFKKELQQQMVFSDDQGMIKRPE